MPRALPPNRSIPSARVIPVLAYPDVRAAVAWLGQAFGFRERLQIGDHRAQLLIDDGAAVIVAEYIDRAQRPEVGADHAGHLVMVRVDEVDAHHARARAAGAEILQPPTDLPFGERQYVARDPGGHRWTFSQTLTDADPADWGGVLV